MNAKRFCGLALLFIGLYFVWYAVSHIHEAAAYTGLNNEIKNFFTHNTMWNPLITFFGGTPQTEVPRYTTTTITLLVSGIILSIAGVIIAIVSKKKRSFFN